MSRRQPERRPPQSIDPTVPNVARMHNYLLGGKDNFAADRAAAEEALRLNPAAALCARANRAFMARAVRFAAQAGVLQFLDLGTGLPAVDNVHEVAQNIEPDARTVYVDYDPIVAQHGRALLATDDRTVMREGDLRDPEAILADASNYLDFNKPVCLLLVASLHFVTAAEDPYQIVKRLMRVTRPGSFLVISHVIETKVTLAAMAAYQRASAPVTLRTVAQVRRFFTAADADLVDPGLVRVPLWHAGPDDPHAESDAAGVDFVGGVGRKT
ncbi:SAM-dependent methyltransferase [Nonomuraea sp. NPDC049400]|uniref:SAM-dependent methyltransferase n=1 Tax=Nonomuraea sp. NPDC049400 TaxID=3364352 RepID=UPI0037898AB3